MSYQSSNLYQSTMRELGSRNSIRVHVERDKRLARVLRPYKESRHRVFTHSGRAGRYARPLAVVRVESSGVRPSTACSTEGCPPSQVGGHGNESVRNGLRPFRILLIYQYSISNYQITFTSDHYQCTARVCHMSADAPTQATCTSGRARCHAGGPHEPPPHARARISEPLSAAARRPPPLSSPGPLMGPGVAGGVRWRHVAPTRPSFPGRLRVRGWVRIAPTRAGGVRTAVDRSANLRARAWRIS